MTIDDLVTTNMGRNDKRRAVKKIFNRYVDGKYNPIEAAIAVEKVIGKISGYIYKGCPGSLTISNCADGYSVAKIREGIYDECEDFKAALRIIGRRSGLMHIEDHLNAECSTKHHTDGFWQLAMEREQRLLDKYSFTMEKYSAERAA